MVRLLLFQILYSLAAAAEYGNPPRAATDSGASTTAVPLLLLPAPTQLLVELMAKPPLPHILVVDTPRPRFSFVPRDDVALQRNMTHFRIVVTAACGEQSAQCPVVWDSERRPAVAAPANVPCGVALPPATGFAWAAQWWDSELPSAVASGAFETGLLRDANWHGAQWLGDGHAQFRLTVPAEATRCARNYMRFPGSLYPILSIRPLFIRPGGTAVPLCKPSVFWQLHNHSHTIGGALARSAARRLSWWRDR
jgi:hypothetical protein